ncbi:MAG: DUF1924 domain-containing protein [bacterium]|nr:DUF1924 domain-containing protein [bacterium]
MKSKIAYSIVGFLVASVAYGSVEVLIHSYQNAGAGPFSAGEGRAAWIQEYRPSNSVDARSCASCHGTDLSRTGRHLKTGKLIKPMAISVNPTRLSNPKKVEKWFRRNCRWTLGRECTPQEKGDFIRFMTSQ